MNKALEAWSRKYYRFTIESNGSIQPGDGVSVRLRAAGREVFVLEDELADDNHWPTIDEVIEEAIRRWHADTSPKVFRILFESPTQPPIPCRDWATRYMAMIDATTEAEAREKLTASCPGSQIVQLWEWKAPTPQ